MTHSRLTEVFAELGLKLPTGMSRDGWINMHCPFAKYRHDSGTDNTPSFFVHVNNHGLSGFNCYSCKERGRISKLVRRLCYFRDEATRGRDIRADLYETPDEFVSYEDTRGIVERELQPLHVDAYLGMYPSAWDVEEARTYLRYRGIGKATTETLGLLFDPDDQRIIYPVYDHDRNLFGFTGRTILPEAQWPYPKYKKVKDYHGLPKQHLLLGEQLVRPNRPMWVVEGLLALAVAIEAKARVHVNPLATMGSRLHEPQKERLVSYNQPVYLCYDLDTAGDDGIFGTRIDPAGNSRREDGAITLLKGHVPVFLPAYPQGIEDPDQIKTLAQIESMIAHAECVA